MNFTIVGASGFIGGKLLALLRERGHEVLAPARGDSSLFGQPLGRVIYCAGMTADFAAHPAQTVEAHAGLIARLIEQADYEHIVYLSSTRLYDSSSADSAQENAVLSIDPSNPRSLYDLSKGLGETLTLTASKGRGCVARLSNVFDWSTHAPGFLSQWFRDAALSRELAIDSSPGMQRDYIHLDDAAAALLHLSHEKARGIYNVASGENVANAGIADEFEKYGWNIRFLRDAPTANFPVSDISRLKELGIAPRQVREIVAAWAREHRTA